MICVGFRELRIHVSIELLFGHCAVVVSVHRGEPLLASRIATGCFLTMSGCRDANNCSYRQNGAECPRKCSIVFQNRLQRRRFFHPDITPLG